MAHGCQAHYKPVCQRQHALDISCLPACQRDEARAFAYDPFGHTVECIFESTPYWIRTNDLVVRSDLLLSTELTVLMRDLNYGTFNHQPARKSPREAGALSFRFPVHLCSSEESLAELSFLDQQYEKALLVLHQKARLGRARQNSCHESTEEKTVNCYEN